MGVDAGCSLGGPGSRAGVLVAAPCLLGGSGGSPWPVRPGRGGYVGGARGLSVRRGRRCSDNAAV